MKTDRRQRVVSRVLVGAVVAVLCAGAVTACDASPTAATVDGTRIKQAQLNQRLDYTRQSPAYVGLLQTVARETGNGTPLQLTGQGTNTYSRQLTAAELTNLITADVIHETVSRYHEEPGPAMLQAARSTYEAVLGSGADGLPGLPVAFRNTLIYQLAERAQLERPLSDASVLKGVYQNHLADFYQQVCVRQISVVVPAASGGVDEVASLSEAQTIVASFNEASSVASSVQSVINGGTTNCYSQEQMQALDSGFRATVMGLAPGHAADPQPASAGYSVIAVSSRQNTPYDLNTQKAITAAALELQPMQDTSVISLLRQAHVTVDAQYGTWRLDGGGGTLPAVVPPSAPARAPGVPSTLPSLGPPLS